MRLLLATFVLVVAACGASPAGPDVDAGGDGDGDGDRDGGELTSGLRVEFDTLPAIGDGWDNAFAPILETAEIVLDDLRIVGDAGVDQTRVDQVTLVWADDGLKVVEFPDAPIGHYSRLRADISDFDFEGTFELDGEEEDWEIEDKPSGLAVDLPLSVDLEPGAVEVVKVQIDVRALFDAIDWNTVEKDSGVYTVDDEHPSIEQIYALLVANMTIVAGAE